MLVCDHHAERDGYFEIATVIDVPILSGQEYEPAQYDEFVEVRNFGSGEDGDNPSIVVPRAGGGALEKAGSGQ